MQSTLLRPGANRLVASTTAASTSNSGALDLPIADTYDFIIECTAASGTTPTLDVAIQSSVDGGTTFYTMYRFAQITTTAKRRLNVQGMMGRGEAGTEASIADTGGALNANAILTRKIRIVWTIGGTNPSFTFVVYALYMPRTTAGY